MTERCVAILRKISQNSDGTEQSLARLGATINELRSGAYVIAMERSGEVKIGQFIKE